MRARADQTSPAWVIGLAYVALLLVLVTLAVRSYAAFRVVHRTAAEETSAVGEAPLPAFVGVLAERDSIRSGIEPGPRNPFLFQARKPISQPRERKVEPPKEPEPTLGALLFDTIDPAIQLKLNNTTSSWLKVGDQYRGWTVKSIRPRTVLIEKQGVQLTLQP